MKRFKTKNDTLTKEADSDTPTHVPHKSRQRLFMGSKARLIVPAAVVLLVALAGVAVFYGLRERTLNVTQAPTELESVNANLKQVREAKPAENATKEQKMAYYRQLRAAAIFAGDYKQAVSAFESMQATDQASLTYQDYLIAANMYANVGDKKKAVSMLDIAQFVLPPNDDPNTDYVKADVLKQIQTFREKYKQ